jgi:hypothetical protein
MKKLDLNAYGVMEMTQEEMILVDGGNIFRAIGEAIGNVIDVVGEAIGNAWRFIRAHTQLKDGGTIIS